MLYEAVTCQEADEEIIPSKCIFLPLPRRQAHTDKERPLVMLEGLCLSSPSEHPSQPETNSSVALTSAVITLLLSQGKTGADHKNICSTTELERCHSEKWAQILATSASPVAASRTPARSQAYTSAGMWRTAIARARRCSKLQPKCTCG